MYTGLKSAFGARNISPIRSHTQARGSCFEGWSRYDVFAGHLDWTDLKDYPGPKFVFSILREPRERIASFYFYLLREAEKLSDEKLKLPENTGKRAILTLSPDEYFMGGGRKWQVFLKDHYDNFYCSYFSRRKFRPGRDFRRLPDEVRLGLARDGLAELDFICTTGELNLLEVRLCQYSNKRISLAKHHLNAGPLPASQSRWDALLERLTSKETIARLEEFTALDTQIFNEARATTNR